MGHGVDPNGGPLFVWVVLKGSPKRKPPSLRLPYFESLLWRASSIVVDNLGFG